MVTSPGKQTCMGMPSQKTPTKRKRNSRSSKENKKEQSKKNAEIKQKNKNAHKSTEAKGSQASLPGLEPLLEGGLNCRIGGIALIDGLLGELPLGLGFGGLLLQTAGHHGMEAEDH